MPPKAKRSYRSWDEDIMQLALEEIDKGMSINKASKEFGVPKQTISDRRNQRWKTTVSGRPTELTTVEETTLINYTKYMASIAQPLTVAGIKFFAWSLAKRHSNTRFNNETGPGHTWWASFKSRHKKDITIRKADLLDRGRSRMANMTVMNQHFDLLDKTLTKLGIKDKPKRIYNCDESGMALDRMTAKVIVQRKTKQAYTESKGNRDHITVHTCVSASGHAIPPFIIFEKAFPSGPYARCGPDDAVCFLTERIHGLGVIYAVDSEAVYSRNRTHRKTHPSHLRWPWIASRY